MKQLCVLFFSLFVFSAAFAQNKDTKHKYPVINGNAPRVLKWDTTRIDMGKIKQGVPVTVKFIFTNTGNSPVVITDVHPSCTCTSPDFTKYPVPHDNKGYVMATYNAGAIGKFNKSLSVTTNTGELDILVITGEVVNNIH